MFAISSTLILTSIGAGVDFSRAFLQRQVLSNAARLACQYSARPSIVATAYNGSNGQANYIASVNSYVTTYLNLQNFNPQLMQASNHFSENFSYTMGGTSSVAISTNVPTYFLGMAGFQNLPIGVTISCNNGEIQQTNTQPTTAGSLIINESFETPACSGYCWGAFQPSGQTGIQSHPTTTFPTTIGYTGQSGNQWVITGYCLEIDAAGITVPTAANGNYVAELNCDSGTSPDYGLSAISNKSYYAAGSYELRYSFQSRIVYPDYNPAYICGSTANDVAWANDTNSSLGTSLRNNEIDVYFDADQNGKAPTHTTVPTQTGVVNGGITLAGSNLIDSCINSKGWITRSVKITVTTAGYYWLSFAANGNNDSYGGSLDQILMCNVACTGAVPDSFPSAWPNSSLFEDSFETTPAALTPCSGCNNYTWSYNLNASYGVTNGSPSGWPAQTASGWTVAPYNVTDYQNPYAAVGNQSIRLDIYTAGAGSGNTEVSRPFYLDPGYYKISYYYGPSVGFLGASGTTGVYCTYAPTASIPSYANTRSYSGQFLVKSVPFNYGQNYGNWPWNTNAFAVMMSHSESASYPNAGGAYESQTTFTNPDGTVSTTPTVDPGGFNISSYNSSQANPILDTCGLSSGWTQRTTYVEITKPGQYWLTFAGSGGADNVGASIDDVKITALNSLYGSAPSFYVVIPTPSPAPNSTLPFTGFSIIADRLTP